MFPWEDMKDILSFPTFLWFLFLNIAQSDLPISLQTSLSVNDNAINMKLDIKHGYLYSLDISCIFKKTIEH